MRFTISSSEAPAGCVGEFGENGEHAIGADETLFRPRWLSDSAASVVSSSSVAYASNSFII